MSTFTTEDRINAELKKKAENYALSFFFSFTPDNWSFEETIDYLRKNGKDCYLDLDTGEMDSIEVWEPFETYRLDWIADQMNMMVMQLCEAFK